MAANPEGALRVLACAALCGVGAELLSGYGPSTGHVGQVAFGLVFFSALYGAPALLVRELARRRSWGWGSLLLLYAGLGVVQCCLVDQSLFSLDYQGYDGWQQAREGTWLPVLGISAYNAATFVIGHMIFSFGAPIAVAEAWHPTSSQRSWLTPWGVAFTAVAYGGTAAMVLADPESHSASSMQLIGSAAVVTILFGLAAWVGSHRKPRVTPSARPAVGVGTAATAAGALGLVMEAVPPTWPGVTVYLCTGLFGGWLLSRASSSPSWTTTHVAAVGLGVLVARGLLAFLGDPVGGEVAPIAKYGHNVAMLAIVGVLGWWALRRASRVPTN